MNNVPGSSLKSDTTPFGNVYKSIIDKWINKVDIIYIVTAI